MSLFDNQPPDNTPQRTVENFVKKVGTVLGFEGEFVVTKQDKRGILTVTDIYGQNEKIISASMFSLPDKK